MSPNSVSPAPNKSAISAQPDGLLNSYTQFLTKYQKLYNSPPTSKARTGIQNPTMAAIFSRSNPASPLAYSADQTALLLMDFQGLIVDRCGSIGREALAQAVIMRNWALSRKIIVLHSVVDVHGKPPPTCKGAERITAMLESVAGDPKAAEEPTEIAFSQSNGEYIALKHPGFISGLKSKGAMDLLKERDIQSLIICGLSTSGAVLRTAMPATDEGFVVSVIQDACADPVDGLHDTLMKSVLPSRAHVATAEEFLKQWDGKPDD